MSAIKPSTIDMLAKLQLIPVISLPDASLAEPLGDVLVEAGLPCAEITFRTPAAEEAIRILAKRGDLFVAAGTVLTTEQAQRATDAGASCLLSPGTDPTVIEWCLANQVDMIPGVATPSDIMQAQRLGLSTLKFFPAQAMGGPSALRAIAGPFPEMRFIPTGGISPDNLADYIALPNVLACGGSWIARQNWLVNGEFDSIQKAATQAAALANQ